jgi:hypothetical protein
MKKMYFLVVINLIFIIRVANSQNLISVQKGGNPSFYSQLDAAISSSQVGDTILIPGGIFPISVPINKKLHIVGVGHNPDSTSATLFTSIYGSITVDPEGSNGSLSGLAISGGITSNNNVINYMVKRCSFTGLYLTSTSSGWIFIENVIHGQMRSDIEPGASNCLFSNNIIDGYMGRIHSDIEAPGFTNCIFRNNVYLTLPECYWGCSCYAIKSTSSIIENNIFHWVAYSTGPSGYSIYKNNLFVENWSPLGPGIAVYNIVNQPGNSIFINQSGVYYNYSQDYHLQPTCPGKNAGTDGTDIGIYGGTNPWKEGSIPVNPHVQAKSISGSTDQNGNLNVNIKVAVQDH